jgi:hypothetical protein
VLGGTLSIAAAQPLVVALYRTAFPLGTAGEVVAQEGNAPLQVALPAAPRASPRRPALLHRGPQGDLDPDLVEQPDRAVEQGDPGRADAVGIFPNRDAIVRLVGVVLPEQTDEWAEGRRYLGLDVLARSRINFVPTTEPEIRASDLPALAACHSTRRTQRYTATGGVTSSPERRNGLGLSPKRRRRPVEP